MTTRSAVRLPGLVGTFVLAPISACDTGSDACGSAFCSDIKLEVHRW